MKTYAYGFLFALLAVTLITLPAFSQEKGKEKYKERQEEKQTAIGGSGKQLDEFVSSEGKGIGKAKQQKEKERTKQAESVKEAVASGLGLGRSAEELPPGLEKYEEKHSGHLPPGLEKQLIDKEHLPPGL